MSIEADIYIGHWAQGLPYIFTGDSFENATRSYFVHENTIVFLEDGSKKELYHMLNSDFDGDCYLFDPIKGKDCARFFKAMNPYTVDGEDIRVEGEPIDLSDNSYLDMWLIATENGVYGSQRFEVTTGNDLFFNLERNKIIRTSLDEYKIPKGLLNKTSKYDWNTITSKQTLRKYRNRQYIKYVSSLEDNDRFPRKKWNKRDNSARFNVHWGQLKLHLSEIKFLTEIDDGYPSIVVYAGAAAGFHISLLAKMFPHILFILYDPAKFGIKPSSSVIIRQEFFTDEIAEMYKGMDVIFISDIRLDAGNDEEFEKKVHENNQMMERWISLIESKETMLKFRFPFYVRGSYTYLKGRIDLQQFAPQTSAETRLRITGHNPGYKEYDPVKYEEQMFYFNTTYRNRNFLDKESVFGVNYDTYSMYVILKNYLMANEIITKKTPTNEVRSKIAAMMLEIQRDFGLNKNKFLFRDKFFKWLR